MRRTGLALLALLCACGPAAGRSWAAQKQSETAAVFTVKPVKNSFSEGEAMLLLLGLQNTGRQAIIADSRFALGSTIHVSITGPHGEAIDWQGSFQAQTPGFQALDPGSSITRVVCLNCGSRDPYNYPFRQPGSYTVRMQYEASALSAAQRSRFPGAVALAQTVRAAPFEVHVTPPVVRFTAQPAKSTFHVGEPILFHFRLQNTGSQGVLAAYDLPLAGAVRLKVVDANGKQVPWGGKAGNAVLPLLSTVDAGSAVEANYAITPENLFGTMTRGLEIHEPGTYTVYAVYDLGESIDELQGYVGMMPILIVPGPLVAPPVKFTVLAAPAPAQEKQ